MRSLSHHRVSLLPTTTSSPRPSRPIPVLLGGGDLRTALKMREAETSSSSAHTVRRHTRSFRQVWRVISLKRRPQQCTEQQSQQQPPNHSGQGKHLCTTFSATDRTDRRRRRLLCPTLLFGIMYCVYMYVYKPFFRWSCHSLLSLSTRRTDGRQQRDAQNNLPTTSVLFSSPSFFLLPSKTASAVPVC